MPFRMTLNWGYALSSALFIGVFIIAVAADYREEISPVSVLGRHRRNHDHGVRRWRISPTAR